MNHGVLGVRLPRDGVFTAPLSGVRLGRGEWGPVSLRLFRLTGTRVTVLSTLAPAQLLALRVAVSGTPVHVATSRPQLWEPALPRQFGARIATGGEPLTVVGGPALVVDDRPAQPRGNLEAQPWQCRLDVRTDWSAADLAGLAYTDLTVLGRIAPELTSVVASAFALPRAAANRIAHLDPTAVALLRRGRLEIAAIDPTPAERQLLDASRGSGAPAAPAWR